MISRISTGKRSMGRLVPLFVFGFLFLLRIIGNVSELIQEICVSKKSRIFFFYQRSDLTIITFPDSYLHNKLWSPSSSLSIISIVSPSTESGSSSGQASQSVPIPIPFTSTSNSASAAPHPSNKINKSSMIEEKEATPNVLET